MTRGFQIEISAIIGTVKCSIHSKIFFFVFNRTHAILKLKQNNKYGKRDDRVGMRIVYC